MNFYKLGLFLKYGFISHYFYFVVDNVCWRCGCLQYLRYAVLIHIMNMFTVEKIKKETGNGSLKTIISKLRE